MVRSSALSSNLRRKSTSRKRLIKLTAPWSCLKIRRWRLSPPRLMSRWWRHSRRVIPSSRIFRSRPLWLTGKTFMTRIRRTWRFMTWSVSSSASPSTMTSLPMSSTRWWPSTPLKSSVISSQCQLLAVRSRLRECLTVKSQLQRTNPSVRWHLLESILLV